jgi:hypothetical protein
MKSIARTSLTALLLALAAPGRAADDPAAAPSCFGGVIRISALIQVTDRVKVGFVDARDGSSHLLSPGETAGDVIVVDADYATETVVLQLGDALCTLRLNADPDADRSVVLNEPVDETYFRGEAIERFLTEFPNAIEDGLIKFPLTPPPPVTGKGETIERFLNENPEWRALADMVVTGRGPGIEALLAENPELDIPLEIPPGSLGPGIEQALRDNPDAATNIQMNFPLPEGAQP